MTNGRGGAVGSPAVPAARHRLVGREREVDHVLALLNQPEARCVSLIGLSGIGKSTIAEMVLRRLVDDAGASVDRFALSAGPSKIELAALQSCLAGGDATVMPRPPPPPSGRRRFVIVDGADGSQAVAPILSKALDGDPGLTVLITSLRRAGLRGEHTVLIGPLEVPPRGATDPARFMRAPAVQVLHDSILAGDPGFRLTPTTTVAIVELCRELDGHPLALHLAGRRCASLSVPRTLDLWRSAGPRALTGRGADGPDHHRALGAALDLSWQALSPDARDLLPSIATLLGPFGWEAALAVAPPAWESDGRHREARLAEALDVSLDSGLIRRETVHEDNGERRFVVGGPVRRFATARASSEELAQARRRHTAFHRTVAREVAEWRWSVGMTLNANLAAQREDLLSALGYVVEHDTCADALSFAVDLEPLWMTVGAASGSDLIESLLTALRSSDHGASSGSRRVLMAKAITTLVTLRLWSPQPLTSDTARQLLGEAGSLARRANEPGLTRRVDEAEVRVLLGDAEFGEARRLAVDGAAEARAAGDVYAELAFRKWAAVAENNSGNRDAALEHAIVARDLAQQAGDEHHLLLVWHVMAGIPGANGDPRAMPPSKDDLLALARRLGDDRAVGLVLVAAAIEGTHAGQPAVAARRLLDLLETARRTGTWYLEELALFVLVPTAALAGEEQRGAEIHGSLHQVLPLMRARVPPAVLALYEHAVRAMEEGIGQQEFARRTARGRTLNWSDAVVQAGGIASAIAVSADTTGSSASAGGGRVADAPALTRRERQVLELLVAGASNKSIGVELGLRPKTVTHYASTLYRKLGASSRGEAVHVALSQGLFRPDRPTAPATPPTR